MYIPVSYTFSFSGLNEPSGQGEAYWSKARMPFPTGGIARKLFDLLEEHDLVKFQGRRYSPDGRRFTCCLFDSQGP